jgi:hypothetical protein
MADEDDTPNEATTSLDWSRVTPSDWETSMALTNAAHQDLSFDPSYWSEEPDTSTKDKRYLYRAAPAYVPVDGGFELEWRRGPIHVRVAITRDRNYVWLDNTDTDEFEHGPLEEQMARFLDVLATINQGTPK